MAGPERRDGRTVGKPSWRAASNWAEQVSMADQTHMQRGSKEREREKEWATSKVAGQARL